jgi:hypothetical protein
MTAGLFGLNVGPPDQFGQGERRRDEAFNWLVGGQSLNSSFQRRGVGMMNYDSDPQLVV